MLNFITGSYRHDCMMRSFNRICRVDYVNIVPIVFNIFSLFNIKFEIFNIKNRYLNT